MNLLWQPHNHASVGALRAQIPTESPAFATPATSKVDHLGNTPKGSHSRGVQCFMFTMKHSWARDVAFEMLTCHLVDNEILICDLVDNEMLACHLVDNRLARA